MSRPMVANAQPRRSVPPQIIMMPSPEMALQSAWQSARERPKPLDFPSY